MKSQGRPDLESINEEEELESEEEVLLLQ